MFEEGNILDWNLSNFVSVGLIGATWLVVFSLGRKLIVKQKTTAGATQFNTNLNTGVSLG